MKLKIALIIAIFFGFLFPIKAQLVIGISKSEVNFREGPGMNFNVIQTIDKSDLLVILPREQQNGFVEVFDVETNSRGFVFESLIRITDTLNFQNQNFFEKSDENASGDLELVLVNLTDHQLYIWINNNSYDLSPHEKKTLIMQEENITYFSSVPGLFPIFGKEILKKGNTYQWKFSP